MSQATYGRNRKSIADLEHELYDLFREHPASSLNDSQEPVIPGAALVDILRTFSSKHDAVDLMSKDEEDQLKQLIETNPGLEVTPQILIQFIVMRTALTPSPKDSPPNTAIPEEGQTALVLGRTDEKVEYEYESRSRSSSRGSIGTSVYRPQSRPPSRPPSRGPPVPPKTPVRDSPFDVTRRQRTQPLNTAAPSSWTRRPPPARRKSDAGAHSRTLSDSESSSPPSIAYSRSSGPFGRTRGISDPKSPDFRTQQDSGALSPISIGSPSFGATVSRPHSRAQSQPQGTFVNLDGFASRFQRGRSESPSSGDEEEDGSFRNDSSTWQPMRTGGLMSPPPSDQSEVSYDEEGFAHGINSLPMPRRNDDSDSDSDSDADDIARGLVHERTVTMSTISLDMQERIEALQKVNDDLRRKLNDAEETLQRKLTEHEIDLENLQQRIEEIKSELSATKRQEKELRVKERTNTTQISALEMNISQLTKSLETSRLAYANLQSQYTEQCNESQRYRELLIQRDEEFRAMKDASSLQLMELKRWEDEANNWQLQIKQLEEELSHAQLAQQALDEQKQENMILKETIDRMRFEMDELRTAATSGGGSGAPSVKGSVSKSLGAELLSKMKDGAWEIEEEGSEHEEDEHEEDSHMEDEDTEGEDVIQTIITRTKRKVTSRAKRVETITLDEMKEYSDAGIQSELSTQEFSVQTQPEPKVLTASFSVQTEVTPVSAMSIQTDPEPEPQRPRTTSVSCQTDEPELEGTASAGSQTTEEEDESMTSSSSTVRPPTPKAQPSPDHHHDLPPSYNQVAEHDQDELAVRVANETLKKWHKGLKLPIQPLSGGISEDAVEDWKALKEELGIECSAIDKLVEESSRTGLPRTPKEGRAPRHRSRFYNIYNTYVYGDKEGRSVSLLSSSQFLFCIGASAAVAFLVGNAMAPQYAIPGGATYYDRAAWTSFNSIQAVGEGFPGDGSGAVFWSILGKVGGDAARSLRGWPT